MKTIRIALPLAAAVIALSGLVAPAHAQREGDLQAEQSRAEQRQLGRQQQGYNPFGPAYRGDGRNANDWAIDSRLQAAADRIERGRGKNGITKKEAKGLHKELESIRDRVARMNSDGRMSRRDRDDIDRRLNALAQRTRSQQFD